MSAALHGILRETAARPRRRVALRLALAASVLVGLGAAIEARAAGLDGQRFVPAAGAEGGFHVERPIVPKHLGWSLGAFVAYGHRPVQVRDGASNDVLARPLRNASSVDLVGSIGLFGFLELAAYVPVRPVWKGDDTAVSGERLNARGGLGDVRVMPKVRIIDTGTESFHFSLGAMLPISLPTGDGVALRGAGAVSLEPRVVMGIGGGRWDLALSGGYVARTAGSDLAGRKEISFGGALSYAVAKGATPVDLRLEVYGAHLPDAQFPGNRTPIESLLGAVIWPSEHLSLYVAAGPGLTSGVGAPDFRAMAGLRWGAKLRGRDRFGDGDHDGIRDGDDQCPNEAEDLDGFEDRDGCPDPDNDHDGILDDVDECPEAAEEPGGNRDGCPAKGRVIIEGGEIHFFGKLQFDTGSATLSKDSEPLLDELAKTLKDHPEFKRIEIGGHTDGIGPDGVNDQLSRQRAEAVKKGLVARGIDPARLDTKGFGASAPLSPNTTPAGRARNRRVDVRIEP